jgi:hypothetical protein
MILRPWDSRNDPQHMDKGENATCIIHNKYQYTPPYTNAHTRGALWAHTPHTHLVMWEVNQCNPTVDLTEMVALRSMRDSPRGILPSGAPLEQ